MEFIDHTKENGSTESKNNCRENETDVKAMFEKLHKKALDMGVRQHQLSRLQFVSNTSRPKRSRILRYLLQITLAFSATLVACAIIWHLDWPVSRSNLGRYFWRLQGRNTRNATSEACLAKVSETYVYLLRPPIDCGFCRNVSEVVKVSNITSKEFKDKYAYTGQPIVITDGAANWSALNVISFDFFKKMYKPGSLVFHPQCGFYNFNSDFKNLTQVFQMDENKVKGKGGSGGWYIGWSNCDPDDQHTLSQYYSMPQFLPHESEFLPGDLIHMGTPGYGAGVHLDDMDNPIWQAQITGQKEWAFKPPPECFLECGSRMTVIIHPGEIIVQNGNKWYHSTRVVGDSLSISFASEYE